MNKSNYYDRESVIRLLVNHHSSKNYHPEDHYTNVVNADDKYLGPYIPYIGRYFFRTKPRLLIYAIAQNLSNAKGIIKSFLNGSDKGILRQYDSKNTSHVHIHPYDTGHLRVVAVLVLSSYPDNHYQPASNINDLIAVTNFVKFSFYRKDKEGNILDDNPPISIYDTMWELYCRYEVGILQPDVIVAVGNDVANAIKRGLEKEQSLDSIILKVPFPGRLNLNSRWIPRGKELVRMENYNPATDIAEMKSLLKGTLDSSGRLDKAINTDWFYFKKMKSHIAESL